MANPILIAQHGNTECCLRPDKANRHGLITGATGTGKTITLQTMAEGFSRIGVPVFMADVKGDLAGLSQAGVLQQNWPKSSRKVRYQLLNLQHFRRPCGTFLASRVTRRAPVEARVKAAPAAPAGEQLIRSAASSVGRAVGRQIIRGVLGGIFGGKR